MVTKTPYGMASGGQEEPFSRLALAVHCDESSLYLQKGLLLFLPKFWEAISFLALPVSDGPCLDSDLGFLTQGNDLQRRVMTCFSLILLTSGCSMNAFSF